MPSRSLPRSLQRLLVWLMALGLALPLTSWTPALAEPSPVAEVRASSDQEEPTPAFGPAGQTLVSDSQTQPVGPGMMLTTFDRFDARGWVRGYVLRVDLANPAVSADLLFPGSVAKAEPLSHSAGRQGAVAAVNGDFFDINNTNAPLGAEMTGGQLIKGPEAGHSRVVAVDTNGIGQIVNLLLQGTVTLPSGTNSLAALNQSGIPTGGIGLYTPLWGPTTRSGVAGASAQVREVVVRKGVVEAVNSTITAQPIPEDGYILIGREAGANSLASLVPGDAVAVEYGARSDVPFRFAVGGHHPLVAEGQVVATDDKDQHPRTAVGLSADGRSMILVTVDGRQRDSRGMTLLELGQLMQSLGAHNALNLDGGGSSTFLTRLPGDTAVSVLNSPSDGGERSVPNGLGIFVQPGSGQLTGLRVGPASAAPGADKLFPGLTRRFQALGYDEHFGPAAATSVDWQALPGDVGQFEPNGVFRARKTGNAVVQAQVRSVKGTVPVKVLGELHRIETSPGRLGLAAGVKGSFRVVGYDAAGYSAPIDPADVTLAYDGSLVTIQPTPDGAFQVTPTGEGAVLVTATVAGKQTFLPITIGLATLPAAGFEPSEPWTCVKYPAAVGAACAFGTGRTGQGFTLTYDFSTSTATRAAYVQQAQLLDLPGQPQRVGLWVNGDGQGAWLRMVLRDAANTSYTVNLADAVNWTGWRYVEANVPTGVQYPLRLYRIYPVETKKERQYKGELTFDDLVVKVAATLDVPARPVTPDPLVVQGEPGQGRWRFAVLSDLHVVAAAPDSKDVKNTRTALQQALAAGVDFIIINGDFVDTAYPQDFALAKQVLAEEVAGRVPVYYVPGNHEIMGPGTLANFTAAFGSNRFTFDHKGTRFVLLDSSTGSFRTAEFQQLVELKASLDDAARNPAIKDVVVIGHHPTRDPMPTASSQLSDTKEAALLEQWLTDFREASGGKGAVYVSGHAHAAQVQRVEGLPYVVLGSVGKTPYGPANAGGFYAWGLFGVDPTPVPDRAQGPEQAASGSQTAGSEWLQLEMRPLLEAIEVSAPATMKVGATAMVSATGVQAGGRTFPLAYPASVKWSVVSGEAAFAAATGELTALAPGQVVLRVESGGLTAEVTVTIEP